MTAAALGSPAAPASPWVRGRGRVLDRVAAALLAPVAAPVVAALAWWVRRGDGPPGLVAIERVGAGGRPFRMWKLRTMAAAGAGGLAAGPALARGDDGRVTSRGRWLRQHRLDELPQLLNVARGEMALVGSRPEAPELVDLGDERWRAVLAVPPAVTGPTQLVVHRWEADEMAASADHVATYRDRILPVKLAVDRWYVERGTPAVDLAVLVSMVQRFVLGRPETLIDRWVRREVPEAASVPLAGEGAPCAG